VNTEGFRFNLVPRNVPLVKTEYRRICTQIPVPESIELLEKIAQYESSNVRDQLPVIWDHARDFQIFDRWGNCWIDFTSTIFVTNCGHGNPHVVAAIEDQVRSLTHAYSYSTEIRARFLEALINFTPAYLEKASLYSAGTEATERAIKLIRYFGMASSPSRKVIVAWEGNYHGKTMGAQMLSGQQNDKEWIGFHDPAIVHLPFPYPWVLDEFRGSGADLLHEHLELLALQGVNIDEIAGFVAESFQGWGALFYPTDYMQELRRWTKQRNVLLVFDEIQAGFGRCGTVFGYERYKVEPDLVCCGKGISGSLPLSAVLGRAELIDLDPAYTSTHGGHPVVCAAGLANIEEMVRLDLVSESRRKGEIMRSIFDSWQEKFGPRVGLISGSGLIYAVFIMAEDPLTGLDTDVLLCDRIVERSMEKGVFLIRTGRGSLKFGPPLTISDEALFEGLSAVEEAIKECLAE